MSLEEKIRNEVIEIGLEMNDEEIVTFWKASLKNKVYRINYNKKKNKSLKELKLELQQYKEKYD